MARGTLHVVWLAMLAGCLPSTKVYKNPGENDHGVRFYRPKPYLLVRPMVNRSGEPVDGFVTIETEMLPDFSEEYSIHVRPGLGANETEISLTDGWRLDGLNVDADAHFDDNLEAIAEAGKLIPTLTAAEPSKGISVRATNVPMGFYESVISRGPDCKKRLYGFRYVGFLPYSACPIESCGLSHETCYGSEIFAIVFTELGMEFKPIDQLRAPPLVETVEESFPADAIDVAVPEVTSPLHDPVIVGESPSSAQLPLRR